MRNLFLMACGLCAVALSVVSGIIASGRIPFHTPPPVAAVAEGNAVLVTPAVFTGDRKSVDDLREALEKQMAVYEQRVRELATRESAVAQQKELIVEMEERLKTLQARLDEAIVTLAAGEQANYKKLSEIYSKMDSAGAARLLEQMSPERAAMILFLTPDRQAAAIMDAAVGTGARGAETAAKWSDVIRRLKDEAKAGKK